jgi:hypothetical protein
LFRVRPVSNNTRSLDGCNKYLQQFGCNSFASLDRRQVRASTMVAQAAVAAIEKAKPAVDELISQIEPKLTAAIPTVKLELPRLTADMIHEERPHGKYQRLSPTDALEGGITKAGVAGAKASVAAGFADATDALDVATIAVDKAIASTGALTSRLEYPACMLAPALGVAQGTAEDALSAAAATVASLALALGTALVSLVLFGANSVIGPIVT